VKYFNVLTKKLRLTYIIHCNF